MNEHHTPADTDAVFGEVALDDVALESVRRAVGRLRDECAARPAPEPRGALSLMLLEPRELEGDVRDPWTLPGIAADRPARRGPRLRHRLAVAAAAVVGTAGLATGLAAAQALPAPLQRAMHDVLSFTGVDVPTGDSGTPATTSTTGAAPGPATGAVPSTGSGGLPPSSAPGGGGVPQAPVTLPPGVSVPAVPAVPPTLFPNLTLPSLPLPVAPPPVSTPLTLPTSLPTVPGLPGTPPIPPIPPLIH